MADVKHTPLRLAPAPIHGYYDLLDERDEIVALSVPPEHAARMVLCWNSHDELVEALKDAHELIQLFKTRWMVLPPFADKINRATREGMTMAHMPIMEAEEELRAALSKATHPAPYNTAPESAHVVGSEEQDGDGVREGGNG